MITLGAVGLASATTAQYFAAKASAGFGANIRYAMMQHIQKRSYAELDQMGTNTMITRITSDVNQVQSGVNMALRLVMRSPFVVIGAMVMAFTVDVKCALIFAAVIPLLAIVVFAIMFGSIPLYQNVQKKLDGILGRTRENLLGVRVLRAFRKEQEEMDAFTQESVELSALQKRVGRISALMNPATYILLNLAIVFLIWTGALQVNVGVLTQGAIIALYNYMSQILVELIKLANLIITLTKSIASGNRIQDMLEFGEEPDNTGKQDCKVAATAGAEIRFDHVSCRYPQASADALEDISFTAKAGETIGIIGGTGSGKTTLVNLIPNFYPATAGTVSWMAWMSSSVQMLRCGHKSESCRRKQCCFKVQFGRICSGARKMPPMQNCIRLWKSHRQEKLLRKKPESWTNVLPKMQAICPADSGSG